MTNLPVVLCVVVGIPKQKADEKIRADSPGVAKAVRLLGDFAVSVLQVTEVVDHWVANKDRADPPEEETLKSFLGLTKQEEGRCIRDELGNSSHLDAAHDSALLAVRPFLKAPSCATVVHWDAKG